MSKNIAGENPAIEETQTGTDLVLESPTPAEAPKRRGGRPKRDAEEPVLVLGGETAPATTTTARASRPRASAGASMSEVIDGMATLVQSLSLLAAQVAPGGDLWRLRPEETKAISEPLGRIAHRRGAGKVLHPDVLDALHLAQAIGAAVMVRYVAIENAKRSMAQKPATENQSQQQEESDALTARFETIMGTAEPTPEPPPTVEPPEPA